MVKTGSMQVSSRSQDLIVKGVLEALMKLENYERTKRYSRIDIFTDVANVNRLTKVQEVRFKMFLMTV